MCMRMPVWLGVVVVGGGGGGGAGERFDGARAANKPFINWDGRHNHEPRDRVERLRATRPQGWGRRDRSRPLRAPAALRSWTSP